MFDAAVGAYLQPFFMRSNDEALRAVDQLLEDKDHQFTKSYKDYSLYHLAYYDDSNGSFEDVSPPLRVASLHELKARKDHVNETD
jgi:hypothetical protein